MKKKRRTRKSKGSIWNESVTYLKETKFYVYSIIGLFFFSSLVAFIFPDSFVFFNPILEELSLKIEGKGTGELIWFIFQNNVLSAFIGMIFGFVLGVVPLINTLTNGAVLGYVYNLASAQEGFGVIWLLLPHGIFELPAIFIALGLGLRFGMFVFAKDKSKTFRQRFYGSLKVFLTMVLPLLIVAAVIEGILIASGS